MQVPLLAAFFARDAGTCATLADANPPDVQELFAEWDALRAWRADGVDGHVHHVLFERPPLLDEDTPLIPQLQRALGLTGGETRVVVELERLRSRRDEHDELLRRAWRMRDPHVRAEMRAPVKVPRGVTPEDGPRRVSTGRSFWSPEEHQERVSEDRERREGYKERFGETHHPEPWHAEVHALRRLGMTRDQIWELRQVPLRDRRTNREKELKVPKLWWPSMTKAALTRYTTPAALRTAPRSARQRIRG